MLKQGLPVAVKSSIIKVKEVKKERPNLPKAIGHSPKYKLFEPKK